MSALPPKADIDWQAHRRPLSANSRHRSERQAGAPTYGPRQEVVAEPAQFAVYAQLGTTVDVVGDAPCRPPIRSASEAVRLGPDLSAPSARLLGETVSYLFARWKATGRLL
jgi:hypothetical protein